MPLMQHFRGVIWPRDAKDNKGQKLYRYAVIGLLVTDEPLEDIEGRNEIVVDGQSGAMAESLVGLRKVKKNYNLGTADCVLTSLDHITDGEPEDQEYLEATEARYLAEKRSVKFGQIPEGVYSKKPKAIKIIDRRIKPIDRSKPKKVRKTKKK